MKKKNTFLGVALLIAVLVLGIGYALTTGPLTIEGTATANQSATSFNVKFTNATADEEITDSESNVLASSSAQVTSDSVATMTVDLTNVGDSQTVTFEVTNDSQAGLKAVIDPANVKIYKHGTTEDFSSEYFTVTQSITDSVEIASQDKTTFTVTVELKKAVIGDAVTEKFDVVLSDITAEEE